MRKLLLRMDLKGSILVMKNIFVFRGICKLKTSRLYSRHMVQYLKQRFTTDKLSSALSGRRGKSELPIVS